MSETIGIIVAHDREGAIGRNGKMPWGDRDQRDDMLHFKEVTGQDAVIMGSTTWNSLPEAFRPLPNRQNIVVSRGREAVKGALRATGIGDAYSQADSQTAWVIGGASIYNLALPTADIVVATEIDTVIEDADTFFPVKDPSWAENWVEIERSEKHDPDVRNRFGYTFVTYVRRSPIEIYGFNE